MDGRSLGQFYFDPDDTVTPANGGTVLVDTDGRRFKRSYSGPIDVRWFGAVGDGVHDDTGAIQSAAYAAAGGGTVYLPPTEAFYRLTAAVDLPDRCAVAGSGEVRQTSQGQAVFVATDRTGVELVGLQLRGVGGTSFANGEDAVLLTRCRSARVVGCDIESFRGHAVFLVGCLDSSVRANRVARICDGIRLRGCKRIEVVGNTLRDPSTPDTTFIGGIFLDSTDGHTFGYCTDVLIDGNIVAGYHNAQSFEVHAGERITLGGGNRAVDCGGVGVSVNPYAPADRCRDITIGPMVIECTSAVGAATHFGISVQGGAAGSNEGDPGYWVESVTITGATVRNAKGGVVMYAARGVTLSGLVVDGCQGSALWLAGEVHGLSGQLVARRALELGGRRAAVLVSGACNGKLAVQCDDVGQGVAYDAPSPGLLVDVSGINVGLRVVGQAVGRVDGVGSYTAASTTIDVSNGVRYVRVANAQATVVSDLRGSVDGQLVTLVFADGNTTVDRSNAVLRGAAPFVSTQYATLTLVRSGALWHEVSRSTNG